MPLDVCNLVGRVIRDHGAGVTVGPPGTGVYTEEILESGEIQELEVTTSEAREVELLLVGDDTSSGADHPLVARHHRRAPATIVGTTRLGGKRITITTGVLTGTLRRSIRDWASLT